MKTNRMAAQRGFSLIEALIALVVMAFGLLVLAGVNLKLARNEDLAKQRGEATRLAQEKIEEFRSFTQVASDAAVPLDWSDLVSSGVDEEIKESSDYHTNTVFKRKWSMLDAVTDPMRRLQVTVSWTDRVGDAQSVTMSTVISRSDPSDVGALAFPLPGNTNLKRPKNRNLNIPVPAVDLGEGHSAFNFGGMAVVFTNADGYVVWTCNHEVHSEADLAGCTPTSAYIIAGYISGVFPAGLLVNPMQLTGQTSVDCSLGDALNQNTLAPIPGYKYYLCVVKVAAFGNQVSGTMRLGGSGLNAGATDYLVCRFQYPAAAGVTPNMRNVQPYVNITDALDNQNYVITTASSCPTVSSLATTQHQNCRSNNPNKNVNRATDCPALASSP